MKKGSSVIKISLLSFFLAIAFSGITNIIGKKYNIIILLLIICLICLMGIIFDMIGTAILSCNESSFHAKAAKKVRGAKESIYLIKNSSLVASFCNDVIGDICGVVSGGLGTVLALDLTIKFNISTSVTTVLLSAIISSFTIGSKAISKNLAIKKSDEIIFEVGKLLSFFKIDKK